MTSPCPDCGRDVDPEVEVWCGSCGADLLRRPAASVAATRATEAAGSSRTNTVTAAAPAAGGETWTCPSSGCSGNRVPRGSECPFCHTVEPVHAALRLTAPGLELHLPGDGPWTLGREEADSPQLRDRLTVSRRHCRISRDPRGYGVSDLGSTNGTFVDGERVGRDEPSLLRDGATLRLGLSLVLHVKTT